MPDPKTKPEFDPSEYDVEDPGQPGTHAAAKPAAKPEAAAEPAPVPAKPKFSQRLLRLAEQFGMSKAEIDACDTAADLEAEVRYARAELQDARGRQNVQVVGANAVSPQPAAPAPKPAEVDEDEEVLAKINDPEFGLDPSIAKLLNRLVKGRKELAEEVGSFRKREESREAAARYDAFDAAFESLGESFHAVFGEGDRHTNTDADAFARRAAAVNAAGLADGDSPATMKRKIAAAAKKLFGVVTAPVPASEKPADGYGVSGSVSTPTTPKDPKTGQFVKPAAVKKSKEVEEWEDAQLARPTARNGGAEPKGDAAARKAVEKWHRDRGLALGNMPDATDEYDSLPD